MKKIKQLYEKHSQDIYKYLLHLTHDPTQSEDLLQETFVKAISSIGRFKGNSSIKTWLFGIARNLWLQGLRGERHTLEYNDLLEIYVADNIENDFIKRQIITRVYELLSQKDDRTQKVVNMRIEGFSYTEISEAIGISENSARVIYFRTKKWIESVIKEEGLM